MSRNFRGASLEILDEDDELTDIPLSDTRPLPILPKHAVIENPQFLARSFHSQVYSVSYTDRTLKKRAILKIFPKGLKKRYTNEVNAYRFLNHFGAPAKGVVPRIYGVLPTINKKKLDDLLQDSVPDDVSISLPASGVLMEFIDGVRPNEENMRHSIAVKVLHALDIIHASHVLHGDVEPRNILLDERTGNAVWIDFSSARINKWVTDTMLERDKIKFTLYCTLMNIAELDSDYVDSSEDEAPRGPVAADSVPNDEVGVPPAIEGVGQKSDVDTKVPNVNSRQFYLSLHSFIIATLLQNLAHILLPSTKFEFTRYSPSTSLRSHGILSLTFAFLSFGIQRTLKGDANLKSTLLCSVMFYCVTSLGNLLLAITSEYGGTTASVGWINCILYIFSLLGLLVEQRQESALFRTLI